MDFSVSRCWYSAGDWYMFFIKENFRTSSFFHFRDWLEYRHGGTVLLPNLIAFLHTFRISFLKTFFFFFSQMYLPNIATVIAVNFRPSFSTSVNNFLSSITFFSRFFLPLPQSIYFTQIQHLTWPAALENNID